MSRSQTIQFATRALHPFNPSSSNGNNKFWTDGVANIGPRSSPSLNEKHCYCYTQKFFLVNVRLKWVKHRGFDHIIDKDMDLRAVCMLKDVIKRYPGGCLPVSAVSRRQKELGLTIPVMRFLRRYPTIFKESAGSNHNVPWFRLTREVLDLEEEEQRVYKEHAADSVRRLCKLLMMTHSKKLSLQSIEPLKWDLGLPDDYIQSLVPKYPDYFSIVKMHNKSLGLNLSRWNDEFAISELQKKADAKAGNNTCYRKFKKRVPLAYEMHYPRGYGLQKKVIAWMEEWQKLPYISPYEDSSQLDPKSDLMEKRVVGVFHELLNLTIHKRTERNNLGCLREEMSLPDKFTRIFTRYPGIFYLSLKCSTTTVTLREAYQNGRLVEKHPLAGVREKYFYLMRMGIHPRKKGLNKINSVKAEDSQDHKIDICPHRCERDRKHSYEQNGLSNENVSIENLDSDDSMYDDSDHSEEFFPANDDIDVGRVVRASGR
eukprot:Gb_10276 [translate_table: standard]